MKYRIRGIKSNPSTSDKNEYRQFKAKSRRSHYGGANNPRGNTGGEHFIVNIALWINCSSYLGFCRPVRKMCECFRSEQKKIFLVGKEKQHGLAKTPDYHSIRSVTLLCIRFFVA